jgi:antitoxin VapB
MYILLVYTYIRGWLVMKTARVFKSGNSQAVRLPKEFQLGVKEVRVFKKDGDLILRTVRKTWKDYFERGRAATEDYPDRILDMSAEERDRL